MGHISAVLTSAFLKSLGNFKCLHLKKHYRYAIAGTDRNPCNRWQCLTGLLKGHCIEFKYYADGIHSGLTPPG